MESPSNQSVARWGPDIHGGNCKVQRQSNPAIETAAAILFNSFHFFLNVLAERCDQLESCKLLRRLCNRSSLISSWIVPLAHLIRGQNIRLGASPGVQSRAA